MSAIAGILCYNEETVSIEDSIKLMQALQRYPPMTCRPGKAAPYFWAATPNGLLRNRSMNVCPIMTGSIGWP